MIVNHRDIHIGHKIETLLEQKNMTKTELGNILDMSGSNARHLTTRRNLDVLLTQRIGNVLKYNFFKHFPIDDGSGAQEDALAAKDKQIEALNAKIAEMQQQIDSLQQQTEPLKSEMRILKIENDYLRDFTDFIKATVRPSVMRLRRGQASRKGLSSADKLMLGEGR